MEDLRRLLPPTLTFAAERLRRLSAALHTTLPADHAVHCEVIGLKDQNLIVAVDSPVWRTRLRFLGDRILAAWPNGAVAEPIRAVEFRVVAPPPRPAPRRRPPSLSAGAARCLSETASHLDHPGLGEALQRLAGRHREP